jgi:hypothetical protein
MSQRLVFLQVLARCEHALARCLDGRLASIFPPLDRL